MPLRKIFSGIFFLSSGAKSTPPQYIKDRKRKFSSMSRIAGDLCVSEPTSALYGTGSLSVHDKLEITRGYIANYTAHMRSKHNSLQVSGAVNLAAVAENGNVSIQSTKSDGSGSVTVQASGSNGSVVVDSGSGGVAVGSAGPVDLHSRASTVALHSSGVGGTVSVASALAGVSVRGGTSSSVVLDTVDATASVSIGLGAVQVAAQTTLGLVCTGNASLSSTNGTLTLATPNAIVLGSNATSIAVGGAASQVTISGNVNVTGNMTVLGITTSINTENMMVKDNVIEVNSEPVKDRSGGYAIHRHPLNVTENAVGDVVYTVLSATAQACILSEEPLDPQAMQGSVVVIGGQTLRVSAYTQATRELVLDAAFAPSMPGSGSTVTVFKKAIAAMHYSEQQKAFCFSYGRINDAGFGVDQAPVHAQSLVVQKSISSPEFRTVTVALTPGWTRVPIPTARVRGSFLVLVQSEAADGAAATFLVSKSGGPGSGFQRFRMTSTPGVEQEQVDIAWADSDVLSIGFDSDGPTMATGPVRAYNIKFLGV